MQRRGRGRGGRRGGGGGSMRLKGLFSDNTWKCDCNPRLPAEHFRVKKEGKNKGKWFYTCQQQDPKRCGFFLWDEDAKPREAATVMSNNTTEIQQTRHPDQQEGWNAGRQGVTGKGLFSNMSAVKQERDVTRSPTLSPYDTPQSGSKRSVASTGFDNSDDDWGLEDVDRNDILRVANSYDTPHKAQKMGVYATPTTTGKSTRKLPWLEESLSSNKPNMDHLATPSKAPSTMLDSRPPETPSPQKFKDALVNPNDGVSSLTNEVLAHLSSVSIPSDRLSTLRSILSRHDLKAQGVAKGRDISRLALKAKEAKIVELQSKIVRLEAEREVDRGVIQKLRWDRAHTQDGDTDDNDES